MENFRLQKQIVLAVLQQSMGVPAHSERKFRTQLLMLSRLNFPAGAIGGRGYRGGYSIDHLWQLVLALRMMNLLIPISRVVEMINESWDIASFAIVQSLPASRLKGWRFWWIIDAEGSRNLDLVTERSKFKAALADPRSLQTVALQPGQTIDDHVRNEKLEEYLAIDANRVVEKVLLALATPELQINQDVLKAELEQWSEQPIERVRDYVRRRL